MKSAISRRSSSVWWMVARRASACFGGRVFQFRTFWKTGKPLSARDAEAVLKSPLVASAGKGFSSRENIFGNYGSDDVVAVERRAVVAQEHFQPVQRPPQMEEKQRLRHRISAFKCKALFYAFTPAYAHIVRGNQRLRSTSSEAAREGASSASFFAALDGFVATMFFSCSSSRSPMWLLRGRTDAGHRLSAVVSTREPSVDLVGDVLLGGGLQRILQRLVEQRCAARYRWSAC